MEKGIKEIIWTNPAKEDLKNIFDYLAEFSEGSAHRVVNRILDRTDMLLKQGFSEMGQREPLLEHKSDVYRYLLEGNYKIIYRAKENRIIIDTIFDARQNPEKLQKLVK